MNNNEAKQTILEADSCFCKHGAYKDCHSGCKYREALDAAVKALEQEPFKPMVEIDLYSVIKQKHIEREVLDKIRAEIMDCLKALDEIEKFNIYLPNEISGRRLTYQQCLEFIDKYNAETEAEDGNVD